MNELFEIADEFSVFRDGKYIGTHASTDVTRDDIIRMMVGREITQMFPKEEVPIGDVVLSVKNLTLDGVFHDVSFDVRAGEILGELVLSARDAPMLPRRCSASRLPPLVPLQSTVNRLRSTARQRPSATAWRS